MNIERSSVGEAELSVGLRFLGSANSDHRNTPGCVHGLAPPVALPPPFETLLQPATATASAPTTKRILILMPALLRRRTAQASIRHRCRAACKNRDRRSERSPTV